MSDGDKLGSKQKYAAEILGEELTVTGKDLNEDYVDKLAFCVNKIGAEIKQAYPQLPQRRIMGLTLVNMADKLYKIKDKFEENLEENKNLKEENKNLKQKNEKLRKKNRKLQQKINSLRKEYELEEVER